MKIGILFGGISREREVSLAGAKTVWQCLDRAFFTPIPIFIDGKGRFLKMSEGAFLAMENTRSFQIPAPKTDEPILEKLRFFQPLYEEMRPESLAKKQNANWGTALFAEQLKEEIDFAFLALHGTYGEDGTIQGLLEWLNIPYSGCGVFGSAFSIDKHLQKKFATLSPLQKTNRFITLTRQAWFEENHSQLFETVKSKVGLPFVVKAPYQGSSIGVSMVKEDSLAAFEKAVQGAFFLKKVKKTDWLALSATEKLLETQKWTFLDHEIGFPLVVIERSGLNSQQTLCLHPLEVIEKLDAYFSYSDKDALLSSVESEELVMCESFIKGKEFSCGVLQKDDGTAFALPPTEIIPAKADSFYDYEAKYQVGGSDKIIPLRLPMADLERIQAVCEDWFETFQLEGYARLDGFFEETGEIILIDINTLPGMSPTSLIFRQAAEIGFAPTDLLTYLIKISLATRVKTGKRPQKARLLLENLTLRLEKSKAQDDQKIGVGIFLYPQMGEAFLERARHLYNFTVARQKARGYLFWYLGKKGILKLPIAFLLKPSLDALKNDLAQSLHPLLRQNAEQAAPLRAGIVHDFTPAPQTISFEQLFETCTQIYFPDETLSSPDEAEDLATFEQRLRHLGLQVLRY
jgi:D-alanine-D-alanine ligase